MPPAPENLLVTVVQSLLLFSGSALVVSGVSGMAKLITMRSQGVAKVRLFIGVGLATCGAVWMTKNPVEVVMALLMGVGLAWVFFGPHWSRDVRVVQGREGK